MDAMPNTATTTLPGTEDFHVMYDRIEAKLTECIAHHKSNLAESEATLKTLKRKINAQIKAIKADKNELSWSSL